MERDDSIEPAFAREEGVRADSLRSGGRLPEVGRNGVPYCLIDEGCHRDVGLSVERMFVLRRGSAARHSKADVLIVEGGKAGSTLSVM